MVSPSQKTSFSNELHIAEYCIIKHPFLTGITIFARIPIGHVAVVVVVDYVTIVAIRNVLLLIGCVLRAAGSSII